MSKYYAKTTLSLSRNRPLNQNNKKRSNGFTLLEILLVVGIIAILAGIVIVAINPSKQLATVRNAERKSDLKQLNNAITQFYIDNSFYPASTTLSTTTLKEICNTGSVSATTTAVTGVTCASLGLINLSELVPTYITAIPTDPTGTSSPLAFIPTAYAASAGTGYAVGKRVTNQLALSAPLAELGSAILVNDICSHTPTDPACWSPAVSDLAWGPYGITGVNEADNGSANTVTLAGRDGDYPAADYCDALVQGGYSDWYLPAINQLTAVLDEYKIQYDLGNTTWGGFTVYPTFYWSSTENSFHQYTAWAANYDTYDYTVYTNPEDKPNAPGQTRCLR
jgi:prepilin-type N-terminal cleavage/methylation domain-containing protein